MNKTKNTEMNVPENVELACPRRGDSGLSGARRKAARYTIIICAACTGLGGVAQAQIVPDAGSILRQQEQKPLEVPTRPAPTIKQDEPAKPAPKPGDTPHFMLKGFRVTGNTVFAESELTGLIREYVGRDATFTDLEQAAARISRYYREHGYMVARAYIPAQTITMDGVAEIGVIEGRLGKVELQNKSRVRDSVVRGYFDAFPGTVVTEPPLERKMLLLNELPGVGEAHSALKPGADVGESDLAVDLAAAPFASGSIEYNNQGNYYTGVNQLVANANLLSPLGLGDMLNGQFTKGFDGLEYGRLEYQAPVGSDGFKLGGVYNNTRYRLGKTFTPLDANGWAHTFTLNASYPFKRTPTFNLYGQAAYDWRDFQDRQDAVGLVNDRSTRVARLTLNGDARDAALGGGITVFSLGYSDGSVNIEGDPFAQLVDALGPQTNGHFDKWNANVLRLQSLSQRLSVFVSLSGQKAGKNLDSSEKFFLGGAYGVRAYPTGEAPGDSGYLATAELRYTFGFAALPGVLQPSIFVDAGGVTISENPFSVGPNTRHLSGAGVGLTWVRASDFQVRLSVATRLGSEPSTAAGTDHHTLGWAQATKYF
jgi:hemolysin activation/secretion protein